MLMLMMTTGISTTYYKAVILFCSFPLLFAFIVGGLGFEFCVFVAGWRHALRSEWPFIIIITTKQCSEKNIVTVNFSKPRPPTQPQEENNMN